MKLLLFIIILVVETVLSKKAIWDGLNAELRINKLHITSNYTGWSPSNDAKLGIDRHYLKDEINVFPHVTFVNIQIFPIEVSKYVENGKGVLIDHLRYSSYQIFFLPSEYDEYLSNYVGR
uniref:Uncharacterized protein n=1 Tax=Parastrongyloides trichosuri TaxID=131310 RepID=A0A0N4Z6D9_PARTI